MRADHEAIGPVMVMQGRCVDTCGTIVTRVAVWQAEGAQAMALTHAEPRRIVNDPGVLHAEPILEGTRIPVRTVVLLMRLHGNVSAVERESPSLTAEDIDAALA